MDRSVLARLGAWCFRHSWAVMGTWFVLMVLGGLAVGPVFDGITANAAGTGMESRAGEKILNETSGKSVIGYLDNVDGRSPTVAAVAARAGTEIARLPKVALVRAPQPAGTRDEQRASLIAGDGRAAVIVVKFLPMAEKQQQAALAPVQDRLQQVAKDLAAAGVGGARMRVGGDLAMAVEEQSAQENDLTRSELLTLPLTLLALIVIFGSLAAAGLPVLAAIVSVVVSMTLLLGFATFTQLDDNTITIVTLLGLGLAIDYGLLLVGRYREELSGGLPPGVAIGRAWATAGRTIAFSALTVAASLSAMLVFNHPSTRALGAAGISITVVSMVTALTFTAAMIGLLKRWIRPSRRQVAARSAGSVNGESGFFAATARMVQRRPVATVVGTTAVLLAMAAPLLSAVLRQPESALPDRYPTMRVAADYAASFGPKQDTGTVTVLASTTPATLDAWAAQWRTDRAVALVQPAEPVGATRAAVTLDLRGGEQDSQARALVDRIRANRPAGGSSWVTGRAASALDEQRRITDRLPLAIAVMVISMLSLLFLMTGSLIVPIKAMLTNVISIGAAFGVFTLIFQKGYGRSLLDTIPSGGLDLGALVIVFAFAFGLSMDYEVFLLGRIKEYVDGGADNDTAVRRGLQSTGRIITSAAVLMVIVFGCFGSATTAYIEQVGIGLAVAILIDATLVRCLLVPATMTLLGQRNWWAPGPMRRLHARIGLTETSQAADTGCARSPLVVASSSGGSPSV